MVAPIELGLADRSGFVGQPVSKEVTEKIINGA
jgi:hypothetical protein